MALQATLPSVLEDLQNYLRKVAFMALLGPQTCPCSPFSFQTDNRVHGPADAGGGEVQNTTHEREKYTPKQLDDSAKL